MAEILKYRKDANSPWNEIIAIKGDKGDPGEKGEKGETGAQGPVGPQGIQGERGAQGIQGKDGARGATGPQGPKGDKGDTGERGPQGPAGKDGTMSFEDLTEAQKATLKGDKGDKGDRGEQGIQGPVGPTGATGAQGEPGVKGDKGDKGEPGIQGPQGEPGKDGKDGQDYVLTEADKQEIAGMVEVTGGGGDCPFEAGSAEGSALLPGAYGAGLATGKHSLSAGGGYARGSHSIAFGGFANNDYSVAIGSGTDANKTFQVVIGRGNTPDYKANFIVGNAWEKSSIDIVSQNAMVCYGEENTVHFPGKVVLGADKAAIATQSYVDEKIAATGSAELVIWEGIFNSNEDSPQLSDDEVAKLLEVSSQEVSITLKNYDDNSEITFKSSVYYDEYGSALEFQGVEEATDGLLNYLYVYTDNNMVDAGLANDSGKADIKIFLPGQRDYYTREEADSKMQAAITTALSAIGVAEEGSF